MQELDFSSREAIYGYLTAVDRLSFKQCARSGFIKQAIKTMGFDPLRTADGVSEVAIALISVCYQSRTFNFDAIEQFDQLAPLK